MNKIVLHIGFGKTGSSALQSYLSANPVHTTDSLSLMYCCLQKDGSVLHGDELIAKSQRNPLQYLASEPDVPSITDLDRAKSDVGRLHAEGHTPFFSQEDWGRRAADFAKTAFLEKLDCSADIVVYVRPQVDWFNSGWWQWWAWMDEFTCPEDVVSRWGYGFMCWAEQIERWAQIPGVEKLSVRLHCADAVLDCMQLFGVSSLGEYPKVNVSLPPTLIKLLMKYPELRQVHSADVDAILSDLLQMSGRTPWVVNVALAEQILKATYSDNMRLLDFLDPPSRDQMQANRRWWDVEQFGDRKIWSEQDLQLLPREYEELLRQAVPTLLKLSRRLARMTDS